MDERHEEPARTCRRGARCAASQPSRYDAGTAYLTVDVHQVNNRDPFVYRTTDYGQTWKLITNGIPKSMLSYAKVIYEDPVRRGMLYLGTENAHLRLVRRRRHVAAAAERPAARAGVGIVVQEHFNDLVISTYGRGFWILDDITRAAGADAATVLAGRAPVPAAPGLPLPPDHRADDHAERCDRREEPA